MNSLSKILRIKKEISPKSFFEEMAEDGVLYDYVHKYYPKKIKTDTQFRNDVFTMISKEEGTDSDLTIKYFLERFVESFSFFKEYTQEWIPKSNLQKK